MNYKLLVGNFKMKRFENLRCHQVYLEVKDTIKTGIEDKKINF